MPHKQLPANPHRLNSPDLAARAAALMLDKHAKAVTILDLRGLTSITDFFVICTADSDVQVKAIVDHVDDSLRKAGDKPYHIEGYDKFSWVIVDFVDVVAHVFTSTSREYYGLERLWADAKVSDVTEP